ncbi:MAG: hypothetical protein LBF02_02575 [Mycoplasmataceae bacterium]|nr:hypothetical protein [Mycoplasmataceae bacterium]
MEKNKSSFFKRNKKLFKVLLLILIIILIVFHFSFLTSCQVDTQKIYDSMFPNITVIIVHTLSTILLIIFSIWLIWIPTKNKLDEKKKYVNKVLQDAEEKKQESLKRLIDAENKKLEAYMEAENIISLAKNDSFFEYNEIIEQAQEDALKIKKEALKLKDIYKKEVEVNNNNKILELALFTTKKMLKTKITKNENLKFIDEFKKDLSKKNNNKHKK